MEEINWAPISNKIEELIKERIKDLGLVKTGKLLNSIKVSSDSEGNFSITAEDYYNYLDEEYNISRYVLEGSELISFIENYVSTQIEKNIE
jgi:hypothetical protein